MIQKQYQSRARVQIEFDDDSLTHQEFKDDCDINNLVENWLKTGVAFFNPKSPIYGDVSEFPTFQESQNLMAALRAGFEALSPEEKLEFGLPEKYYEAVLEAWEASASANEEVGTDDSLVVTVPTDTTQQPDQPERKEDHGTSTASDKSA